MNGNGIILFYSWTGNTEVVAREIQAQTGCDLRRIEEVKNRKPGNIPMAAMGGFFHLKSAIKPLDVTLENYDHVFLGAQVWAGNMTPPIRSLLSKSNLKGKKVWLFMTHADDKPPQKVIETITSLVGKKGGMVAGTLTLTAKMIASDSEEQRAQILTREQVREDVRAWLMDQQLAD
jgi:flavodoxin